MRTTLILLAGSALALAACDRMPPAPKADNGTAMDSNATDGNTTAGCSDEVKHCQPSATT